MFDKTIIENIAIGENFDNIDIEVIKKVIEYVNLNNFISTLPQGIYQKIGEMGSKMSGGEKQRLAIARALYKNAELLVLDEATSSLDSENEKEVLNTIYSIARKKNITVLIITHHISAVETFDKVYQLKNGNLFETKLN